MSKPQVISVLDKKIAAADSDSKALEKAFYKGSGGMGATKDFLEEFIKKRKDYHKYSIMKVKVAQS